MYLLQHLSKIAVTMIKLYMYCPVIPWIIAHYNTVENPTESMLSGQLSYEEKTEIITENTDAQAVIYEKHLENQHLAGRADAIITSSGETAIIEIKKYMSRHRDTKITQLKTYAVLMTQQEKPPRKLILIQGGKKVYEKTFTAEDKDETIWIINRLLEVIDSETPPPANPGPRCNTCWYRRLCPYQQI